MKTYYYPNDEHIDRVFGGELPVCIDMRELERLAFEWGKDVFDQFHKATKEEIENYGIAD